MKNIKKIAAEILSKEAATISVLEHAKGIPFSKYNISSDRTSITLQFRDNNKVGGPVVSINFYSSKEIVID